MSGKPLDKHILEEGNFERAVYYPDLDRLEYLTEDCTVISEDVNQYFSILRKNGTDEIVGFTINWPNNFIQELLKQKEKLDADKDS